ncbi:MAG: YebC/PmpR family DNA-binding transcriptional regulator [Planctomycetota bacterium]
MAGHSKFANIKHRKGAQDKKRAKVFSNIARKIIVAAKAGGGDPETNPSLRLEVEKAKAVNMPKDVIQRNIDKGTGVGADAADFVELTYEGYATGGVAVMVDVLTDNRNRTAPEVRKIFEKNGGNMGEPGCVGFMFQTKSVFLVDPAGKSEDEVMELVMEVEADDMESADGQYMITADYTKFLEIKQALEAAGFGIEVAEIQKIADTEIPVDDLEQAKKIAGLVEALEDQDDVQAVYTNQNLSDEVSAQLAEG